ncbi:hypothetical protein F4780DRAFT_447859 [Xylariomycetidae sp. FL0641]|nr:hypothetical protein F4780DRAFT_447859 [Xylariomycetidae sp. FL0641]
MAFHQPTRQAAQRVFRPSHEPEDTHAAPQPASQSVEDSQTWVLFAPAATDAGTTTSYLTSTHKSDITPGRSRLSDLGSLHSIARSYASTEQQHSSSFIDAIDEDDEDDGELDSLDSHLPEFRSTPQFYESSQALHHATPVVPAHDGLGSFQLDREVMGADVQNRLYAFEQYNPRRVKRRRESLDLAQAEFEDEEVRTSDKMRRIEAWRLEQSRYLLEEIQKETRRRRKSSVLSSSLARSADQKAEDVATSSATGDPAADQIDQGEEWHDQGASELGGEHDSVWDRITRKVIRDLMGIDDKMLSILLGEELPDDEDLSSTPRASGPSIAEQIADMPMENSTDSSWQLRMLERVAKELGLLVHQLSGHPGAFSTFSRIQQTPIPYAGLPSIPEATADPTANHKAYQRQPAMPEFKPTIPPQTRPIDVPPARNVGGSHQGQSPIHGEPSAAATFTQDEWEQDLDVRLVFRYLRSRFLSRSNSVTGLSGTTHSHLATSSTQDAAAKAARVRQHHPLVARPRPMERRKSKAATPSSPVLFRHASSCASQSTRRSVRRSSCSSSRHYWDIGGSVGTGSMIATTGPMGSWGEV